MLPVVRPLTCLWLQEGLQLLTHQLLHSELKPALRVTVLRFALAVATVLCAQAVSVQSRSPVRGPRHSNTRTKALRDTGPSENWALAALCRGQPHISCLGGVILQGDSERSGSRWLFPVDSELLPTHGTRQGASQPSPAPGQLFLPLHPQQVEKTVSALGLGGWGRGDLVRE